jgi:hypothetical protein
MAGGLSAGAQQVVEQVVGDGLGQQQDGTEQRDGVGLVGEVGDFESMRRVPSPRRVL